MTKRYTYIHHVLAMTALFSTAISVVHGVEYTKANRLVGKQSNQEVQEKHQQYILKHFSKELQKGQVFRILSEHINSKFIIKKADDKWIHLIIDGPASAQLNISKKVTAYTKNNPNGSGDFTVLAPISMDFSKKWTLKNLNAPMAPPPDSNARDAFPEYTTQVNGKDAAINLVIGDKLRIYISSGVLEEIECEPLVLQMVAKKQLKQSYQTPQKQFVSQNNQQNAKDTDLAIALSLKEKQEREDQEAVKKAIAASREQAEYDAEIKKALEESRNDAEIKKALEESRKQQQEKADRVFAESLQNQENLAYGKYN